MPPNPTGPGAAGPASWSTVPGIEDWEIFSSGGPGHAGTGGSLSGVGMGQQMPQQPVQPSQVAMQPPQVPLQQPEFAFPPQQPVVPALPAQAAT